MEGQFLIRQTYDDEITYNLIGAAVEVLSKYLHLAWSCLGVFELSKMIFNTIYL